MYFRDLRGGRRRGEEGIAMVIDFLLTNARLVLGVGGAAILGIATLAVKRLIERAGKAAEDEKVEQKMVESWEELSLGPASPKSLRKDLEGAVRKHVATATKQLKSNLDSPHPTPPTQPILDIQSKPDRPKIKKQQLCAPLTLQERLQQYYRSRVELSEEEVLKVQTVALDIGSEINGFLHLRHPDMFNHLGEFTLAGSLLDGLQVVSADHVSLLVPVQLDSGLWELIPGEETLLDSPLHWMVRRTGLEYFPRGRSYWDRFLVGGYLSSESLVSMLSKELMETMNWPSLSGTLECLVRPVLGEGDLRLEISNGPASDPVFLCIVPVIRQEDVVLTAQSDPASFRPSLRPSCPAAWRLALYPWETRHLTQLDQSDAGVRRYTLKLLKAVCRHTPALRPLTSQSSAPLSNLLLHLSETQPDWSGSALGARFRDCLEELIGYLETGVLPSYFRSKVNLLSDVTEEEVERMGFMLYCALTDPDILLI